MILFLPFCVLIFGSTIKPSDCLSGGDVQYDAFDLGIITTDEFTNAEILEATYPTVRERLLKDLEKNADRGTPICVVTGFLGKVRLTYSLDFIYYALATKFFNKFNHIGCHRFGLMACFTCTLLMHTNAYDAFYVFLCRVLKLGV